MKYDQAVRYGGVGVWSVTGLALDMISDQEVKWLEQTVHIWVMRAEDEFNEPATCRT